jgi:hypothetical protein
VSTEERERKVLDTAAVLADLAAWWRGDREDGYVTDVAYLSGTRTARRIAGGKHDPQWEIIRQLPLDDMLMPWQNQPEPMLRWHGGGRGEYKYFADRFDMCGTYSWAICSPGDIAWLREVLGGRHVVEAGAGTGYWAHQMEQAGIGVVAYDPNEAGPGNVFARRAWTTVLPGDHTVPERHPDRALFLCWPSYDDSWAAQALACYTGDLLIYCGEGESGCTADDSFFELLDAGWEEVADCPAHVSYMGIHDRLTAYRRKGTTS